MEEQKENIGQMHEIQKNYLGSIFNPAQFKVIYPLDPKENDFLDENKRELENDTYKEIVAGLESDLRNLGIDITYSAGIIIGEIAMNMIFLQRIKSSFICRAFERNKRSLKPTDIYYWQDYQSSPKKSKSITYGSIPLNEEEVHPTIGKLLPQFQKQINDGLKSLGLLPVQQIERQKLIIVKKLRCINVQNII